MRTPIIDEIKILGLFENRDVTLNLKDGCLILIGENGLGKTTILSILNDLLNGRLENLAKSPFQEVLIKFICHDSFFRFPKNVIEDYVERRRRINEELNIRGLVMFEDAILKYPADEYSLNLVKDILRKNPKIEDAMEAFMVDPIPLLFQFITDFPTVFQYRHELKKLKLSVLYYPTYRRIEADIKKVLSYEPNNFEIEENQTDRPFYRDRDLSTDELLGNSLMKFGMNDIENLLDRLIKRIYRSTFIGYSEVTGKMISTLLYSDEKPTVIGDIDATRIEIILQRLGNNLKDEERDKLLQISKGKKKTDNLYLYFFLKSLSEVYHRTEKYDRALIDFKDVCNSFLYDKHFLYDESHISIGLYFKNDKKRAAKIGLEKLSSGEKQLIAMLAYAYLRIDNHFICLIDEPELSLSLKWQKNILPAIFSSQRCIGLVSATHSPFVFQNELEKFAIGPDEYMIFK